MREQGNCRAFRCALDRLKHRPIIACAACMGHGFCVTMLAKSLRIDRLELLQILDEIERETGVIVDVSEQDDVYGFSSTFMLQVVREELGITAKGPSAANVPQLVREYHARLAAVLEETLDPGSGALFDVAGHFCAAGKAYADKGLHFASQAIRAACDIFDYDQARICADMADECAQVLGGGFNREEERLLIDCEEAHMTGNKEKTLEAAHRALKYEFHHPEAPYRV